MRFEVRPRIPDRLLLRCRKSRRGQRCVSLVDPRRVSNTPVVDSLTRLAATRLAASRYGVGEEYGLEVSLSLIRCLRPLVEEMGRRDAGLARQLKRAAPSVALNTAEGNRRRGRDRLYHWSIAAGSADETRTALRVAIEWREVPERRAREALELLDRVLAMLWKLTH